MLTLDTAILNKVQSWIEGNYDKETKKILTSRLENKEYDELTDAFYKGLEFGTGGLRGIMGPGTNRINKYTIGMTTQGLCNYLKKTHPDEDVKVAISYDSRNKSDILAEITADVFSANGIFVYFFKEMRPTPQLSFAIRQFDCKSGVMITASHNPKEYNGYKAYGPDGCQVVSPMDKEIIDEVRKISSIDEVRFERVDDNIEMIKKSFDREYHHAILSQSISKEAIRHQSDLKIVYSAIHGTGAVSVPPVLTKMGFNNLILVEEQMKPDGNFPTVVYPNPEEMEAMTLALKKAKEVDADIVMATDPDADRVGIAVKNDTGKFILLNGNETAVLLFHYVLNAWKRAGKIQGNEYIVKTIVTSYLLDKIAESVGVECYNTLTGFKHMGSLITSLEGKKKFIIGGEESFGYMIGDYVRDKDAVVSCAMIAEMCAFYKDNGKSLYEALKDIHLEYGLYLEKLVSIRKEGKKGSEEIQAMMDNFRSNPPKKLGGSDVAIIKDYLSHEEMNLASGKIEKIDLPTSNVLQFLTTDGSIISARPSGTEPKIKFYVSVNTSINEKADYDKKLSLLSLKIDGIVGELGIGSE